MKSQLSMPHSVKVLKGLNLIWNYILLALSTRGSLLNPFQTD